VGGNTTKAFGYDDCGRTTSVTVGGNTTTLAYDFENRLISITYPSSATNTFTYNALGTRVSKVDSLGSFAFKRDGVEVTSPALSDSTAGFTPSISERRGGATKFYHQNDLGTVSRITNTSQSTTDTRSYDAFGVLVASSGSTPTPFGYAGAWGYQEDADSGLKLLGHRYYDPSIGRFLTADVAKEGRNWYGYVDANPIKYVDPFGYQKRRPLVLVVLGDRSGGLGVWPHQSLITNPPINDIRRQFANPRVKTIEEPTSGGFVDWAVKSDAIYFYGHGWDGLLTLNGDDAIGNDQIDEILRRRKGKRIPLMFLETCESLCGKVKWNKLAVLVAGYTDCRSVWQMEFKQGVVWRIGIR